MKKMKPFWKDKNFWFACLPYVLIFGISLLPFIVYFRPGISGGEDTIWHLYYMYDLYYGWKNGFTGTTVGHLLMGDYGYDVYLFYGPLPHYLTVILVFMFEWAGANIIEMMKIVTVASVFVSAVVVYLFAYKVSGSKKMALAISVAWIFFPYRLYALFYRGAFSEGFAHGLIPFVFYGLYRILNDDKFHVSAYVMTVVGIAAILLSHPFTGFATCIAAIGYLLVNIKKLLQAFHRKTTWIFGGVSVLLVLGLIGFYFFPMSSALNTGYYRLSDAAVTWTDLDNIYRSIELNQSLTYSGFLNWDWLLKVKESYGWTSDTDTPTLWTLSIAIFLFSAISTMVVDYFLQKAPKNIFYRWALDGLVLFVIPLACQCRQEIYLASIAFYVLLMFATYIPTSSKEAAVPEKSAKQLLQDPTFYFLLVMGVILLIMLFVPAFWAWLPSIFYKAQFPFRLWSLFVFLALFLVILVCSLWKKNRWLTKGLMVAACFLLVVDMAPVDKRIAFANDTSVATTITTAEVSSRTSIGAADMNEYMPRVFFDKTYVSSYANSLYPKIQKNFAYGYYTRSIPRTMADYEKPAFLTGSGKWTLTSLKTPEASFDATITSETALVQIPQFYYDGYVALLKPTAGGATTTISGQYVDGLVAFQCPQGDYAVQVKFIGSKSYRVFTPIFYVSLVGLAAMGGVGLYLRKKEEKKEKEAAA